MQDNDPKHTSRLATKFFDDNGVNWWRTAPELPDLNPLKNVWHELKEFVRREIIPQSKNELVEVSKIFGKQLTLQNVSGKFCTRFMCIL